MVSLGRCSVYRGLIKKLRSVCRAGQVIEVTVTLRGFNAIFILFCSGCSSSSSDEEDENLDELNEHCVDELQRKRNHPERAHEELWFNEPMEVSYDEIFQLISAFF